MTTFSWLHGTCGTPCRICGSHISSTAKMWDHELRQNVPMDAKCDPCRGDEFRGRGSGTQYRPPASGPSHRPDPGDVRGELESCSTPRMVEDSVPIS